MNRVNKQIAKGRKAMLIETLSSLLDDDDSDVPHVEIDNQLSLDDLVKPVDKVEDKNWRTLDTNASCKSADHRSDGSEDVEWGERVDRVNKVLELM